MQSMQHQGNFLIERVVQKEGARKVEYPTHVAASVRWRGNGALCSFSKEAKFFQKVFGMCLQPAGLEAAPAIMQVPAMRPC